MSEPLDPRPEPALEAVSSVPGVEPLAALDRLRQNIDSVDEVLVKLLNQRAKWALEIGKVKKAAGLPIYQPEREARVVAHVVGISRGPLEPAAIQRLFERVIDESRRIERVAEEP